MEHGGSLPYSQEPATYPYPEPDHSSLCHPSHFSKIHLTLYFHLSLGLPSGLIPSHAPTKTLYACLICPIPATCLANLVHITTPTFSSSLYLLLFSVMCALSEQKTLCLCLCLFWSTLCLCQTESLSVAVQSQKLALLHLHTDRRVETTHVIVSRNTHSFKLAKAFIHLPPPSLSPGYTIDFRMDRTWNHEVSLCIKKRRSWNDRITRKMFSRTLVDLKNKN